ncbi:FAD-dependent oxidoreductase [Lignipirellula cremea]|uniref:FAD dependent oxidoreductase n=1 Tax=Lignipirellula cremea TaxID=2528010 RepID=A0A518E590_9BACT|nr:FAD-dependent oxidoreductase [Lignipirellula cremea]QDU99254.1 FAD dependent oxidoreductase [Lignipirellula cremea]
MKRLRLPFTPLAILALGFAFAAALPSAPAHSAEPETYDVVVYGGTSGGAAAAIQARRMGKSVILIEPGQHLGGLTSGGLGATDIGNKRAIGGVSREFYQKIREYYADDANWTAEKRADFPGRGHQPGEDTAWTFEPHAAEHVYQQMLREAKAPVLLQQRLDLRQGVKKVDGQIVALVMESGRAIAGRMFIDATYEGDLLALAGVSYHVGREANSVYQETLNGVQTKHAVHHQFSHDVDPYVVPGDPASGLLPGVQDTQPGEDGSGDNKVQAYCFRLCTTDAPGNRAEWKKPAGYDERQYELLLRNFEAGDVRVPWHPSRMPNRKTDTNNNFAISTDNIGQNYAYPDGDYATREAIIREHLDYQQGLMWTLAHHPRVPENVRQHFQTWRPAKDEFRDTNHWPHQLYVREARRMISDLVMNQNHCQGRLTAPHSVGLAAYTMDSHNIQRYVSDGKARNEGDVQVGGFGPYPIAFEAIRPRKSECKNLLVPVCLSASHIAFGSIRMEPVFMVLGQSAATAACQAIDQQVPIQDIDQAQLQKRLLADGQVLDADFKQ